MTTLFRLRTLLTGFPGAPGVATMYFLDVSTAVESVSRLWQSWAVAMPNDVTITPERTGDTIEDTTGALVGQWVGGVVTPSQGSGGASYAAPVGAVAEWATATILDRKRLRGRTFIVPLSSANYLANGSVGPSTATGLQTSGTQFILEQSTSAVVWHRPFKGSLAIGTKPARPAHLGGHGLITACRVPTLAAVLRSRRD